MEFLVNFEVKVPGGATASEVQARKSADASSAAALAHQDHLLRLWKLPAAHDDGRILGLYRADRVTGVLAATRNGLRRSLDEQ
jgi:muconolactone delta-isomerase